MVHTAKVFGVWKRPRRTRRFLWILNNGGHLLHSEGTRPFTWMVQRHQTQKRYSATHDRVQNSKGQAVHGDEQ